MGANGYVFVYRDVSAGVWDSCLIKAVRLPVYLEGGWHVLITEEDIHEQAIADHFAAQTLGLRERL